MKPCWKDWGLTEKGAEAADAALEHMTKALDASEYAVIANVVLGECVFRKYELPTRTKKYQKEYLRKNGK